MVVTDSMANQILIFHPETGEVIREIGSEGKGEGEFDVPNYVAFDREGNYLVTDDAHRIQVFTPSGEYLRTIIGPGRISVPIGIDVDMDGTILVCEYGMSSRSSVCPHGLVHLSHE